MATADQAIYAALAALENVKACLPPILYESKKAGYLAALANPQMAAAAAAQPPEVLVARGDVHATALALPLRRFGSLQNERLTKAGGKLESEARLLSRLAAQRLEGLINVSATQIQDAVREIAASFEPSELNNHQLREEAVLVLSAKVAKVRLSLSLPPQAASAFSACLTRDGQRQRRRCRQENFALPTLEQLKDRVAAATHPTKPKEQTLERASRVAKFDAERQEVHRQLREAVMAIRALKKARKQGEEEARHTAAPATVALPLLPGVFADDAQMGGDLANGEALLVVTRVNGSAVPIARCQLQATIPAAPGHAHVSLDAVTGCGAEVQIPGGIWGSFAEVVAKLDDSWGVQGKVLANKSGVVSLELPKSMLLPIFAEVRLQPCL